MDRETARDEMLGRLKSVWDGAGGGEVLYDDVAGDVPTPEPGTPPWARVTVRHSTPDQRGISFTGRGKYMARGGTLTVQVFSLYGDGLALGDAVVKAIEKYLPGSTPGGLKIRDVGGQEVGGDGPWYQTNVTANFDYDDFV